MSPLKKPAAKPRSRYPIILSMPWSLFLIARKFLLLINRRIAIRTGAGQHATGGEAITLISSGIKDAERRGREDTAFRNR
jgi:hypothetical protein